MLTVHLCTAYGTARKYHRVERWMFIDGYLSMLRDGIWERVQLRRGWHIGAYATREA